VTRLVPTATYCPASTLRSPSLPAKGARIAFCAITARVRVTAAAATSRAATAESTDDCGVLPLEESCFCRSRVTSVFLSCASPLTRSACSIESSIFTNSAPASTLSPDSKWIVVTTPGTCGAIATPWNARNVPIAVRRGGHCSVLAVSTATAVGFGAKAALRKPFTMAGFMTN